MTEELQDLKEKHAAYMSLTSIGKSPEGRDLWLVGITEQRLGEREKPAVLVDANIHAGEVTGQAAAMAIIRGLLQQIAAGDEALIALFAKQTLWVLPRLAVDGAERYLTSPERMRSAPRFYPNTHLPPGFQPQDLDGDGQIRSLRVRTPFGRFRASSRDPRLLVPRRPGDAGPFYEVLPEGRFAPQGPDARGAALTPAKSPWGLDFNRNYPAHWKPSAEQPGSGRHPLSEPETKAVASVLTRPEVYAYLSLHTSGGVLLRPPAMGGDETLPLADVTLYERIGEMVKERTGLPMISTRQAFSVRDQDPQVKGADDWAYEHFGKVAFTLELWNLAGRAGAQNYAEVGRKQLAQRTSPEVEDDLIKQLQYIDAVIGEDTIKPWQTIEHPDFEQAEIGGYDPKFVQQNPPLQLLPEECDYADAIARLLLELAPDLAFGEVVVQEVSSDVFRVRAEVGNYGHLGSHLTTIGKSLGAMDLRVTARLTDGQVLEPVAGSMALPALTGTLTADASEDPRIVYASFLIKAKAGTIVMLELHHPICGRRQRQVAL